MARSRVLPITDPTMVGEVRRLAADMCRELGFDETESGKVGIVTTEAANNLIKHARQGQILLRPLVGYEVSGIEILSVDRGPGMADVSRCLQDGYSTAGSPGTGLGAIARLSNVFDIYSLPEIGTVQVAQLWAKPSSQPRLPWEIGTVCVPYPGETACGDNWSVKLNPEKILLLVADGLGHGPMAAKAADEAVRVFEAQGHDAPTEILQQAHGFLRATRGASVAVAEVRPAEGVLRFAGVGNIAGTILGETGSRSVVSHNGTLGHEILRLQEFVYPWSAHSLLVLHSDGLQSRWSLDPYPGLCRRHPALIAGVLYREFQRGRDDVTVVVIRPGTTQVHRPSSPP